MRFIGYSLSRYNRFLHSFHYIFTLNQICRRFIITQNGTFGKREITQIKNSLNQKSHKSKFSQERNYTNRVFEENNVYINRVLLQNFCNLCYKSNFLNFFDLKAIDTFSILIHTHYEYICRQQDNYVKNAALQQKILKNNNVSRQIRGRLTPGGTEEKGKQNEQNLQSNLEQSEKLLRGGQ